MKLNRAHLGYVATLAAGVAIGLIVVGTAAASPATPKAPAAPGAPLAPDAAATTGPPLVTHHLSIAASAFAPDSLGNTTQDYQNQWDPTALSDPQDARCFNAGLQFPPSVTLKSVKFYYTAGSKGMELNFNRQDLINHTFTDLAKVTTASSSSAVYKSVSRNVPSADATVNMTNYAYSVGVCPAGTTSFSGVTVTYTEPAS
jgi:hypothetical protein